MSLNLDQRQRAMLLEMGVRVWQAQTSVSPSALPATTVPAPAGMILERAPVAIDSIAAPARATRATGTLPVKPGLVSGPRPVPQALPAGNGLASWSAGKALPLYDAAPGKVARWLVLLEAPAAALQSGSFNPFEGDAGKLLDNMLRAARLNLAGAAMLAPLVRQSSAQASQDADLGVALPALLAAAQPDVLLVMGRLAAQALLQSSEPFGKLRGQLHSLHGIQTIVTHDAAYLLRNPLDKARAWDDLCLAMDVAGKSGQ